MEAVNIEVNERHVFSSVLASLFDLVVEATGMSLIGFVDQLATKNLEPANWKYSHLNLEIEIDYPWSSFEIKLIHSERNELFFDERHIPYVFQKLEVRFPNSVMNLLNQYANPSISNAVPASHMISGILSVNLTAQVVWVVFDGDVNAFGFDDASAVLFHDQYSQMNLDLSVMADIVSALHRMPYDCSEDDVDPRNTKQNIAKKILENISDIFHSDFQKYLTMFYLTGDIQTILKNLPD